MAGSAEGPPRNSLADKVEQARQKVKAQGSANLGPSSRLAAAVAGPIKAKKRKVGVWRSAPLPVLLHHIAYAV